MKRLPNTEFQQTVPLLREKGFYEHEEPRKIFWPEYTQTQIDDAQETLDFIKDTVDMIETMELKGKVGKPLTDPRVLTKAVLVSEALGLTERNAEGWLKILGPYLGIYQELDDRTIGDGYDKIEVLYILKQIFEKTKDSDGKLSGDGTGLESTRKQNYESAKKYEEYLINIVDSHEIVQAFNLGSNKECKTMHKLIDGVYGNSLRLDAGFNDRELVNKIARNGMTPFVFPKCSNVLNGSLPWKQMYHELLLDVMHWLTQYHLRSHAESFYSSFKRVYGPLTKRRFACKLAQVTARIILHNRRKLSYYNKILNAN